MPLPGPRLFAMNVDEPLLSLAHSTKLPVDILRDARFGHEWPELGWGIVAIMSKGARTRGNVLKDSLESSF